MGVFRKYNGKEGKEAIHHTSTGYKCLAYIDNIEDKDKEIYFYAKHIVGNDGRPYTEFGFESVETYAGRDLMEKVKISLIDYGFEEVFSIGAAESESLTFSEYANPIPNVVEFRANAGKHGVMKVFEALDGFIAKDCIDFVIDQEENLEENLQLSILESMGNEMKKGPGGIEAANLKAKNMAMMFINGIAH